MKPVRQFLDATFGRWIRHFFFILLRSFYGLFYNISCSNKALLQDLPSALVLSTHVSRHDGPLVAALLYTTRRVRPAVHYSEYYSALQWFPLMIAGSIPLSSPKKWSPERRAARKETAMYIMRRVIENGSMALLFPAGRIKRQAREIIEPHFSGAYETLKALGPTPVVLVRIRGLSAFEPAKYDLFWSFIGRQKGRRHVFVDLEVLENGLSTDLELADFNADLERRFNDDPALQNAAE